ncbi:unnamed protein product [Urochloa humidicola]
MPQHAQGKTHDEMTVTWTSGYDISETYPFVEWGGVASGRGGAQPARSPAGTLTFSHGSMCGEPARTVGWRDPGFIHTAFLRDLWPNREYYYKIGHELQDGSVVWGKPYTFRALPSPGQNSLQRVIVFGNMGKAERDGSNEFANYQPGSLNTTDTLVKDLDNYNIVFHIGDLPYANGYISQWDQFTAQVALITATKPYMIASGNHEKDWPNTGGFFDVKDSGGECGVPAETYYYYPAENRGNFWYKVDYGMFRGYLIFCHRYQRHLFKCQFGVASYRFVIAKLMWQLFLPFCPAWQAKLDIQRGMGVSWGCEKTMLPLAYPLKRPTTNVARRHPRAVLFRRQVLDGGVIARVEGQKRGY